VYRSSSLSLIRTSAAPSSTLFPYTTLFRSDRVAEHGVGDEDSLPVDTPDREELGESLTGLVAGEGDARDRASPPADRLGDEEDRSEEHTSELQSQSNLVCRLLLEKKKNTPT